MLQDTRIGYAAGACKGIGLSHATGRTGRCVEQLAHVSGASPGLAVRPKPNSRRTAGSVTITNLTSSKYLQEALATLRFLPYLAGMTLAASVLAGPAVAMREGEGAKLKTVEDTPTLEQPQPAIDIRAEDVAAVMQAVMAAK